MLAEITGMAGVSLQPAAGAHGELTGIMIIRAYRRSRGDAKRTKMLVPDTAHGTNPASSALAGYQVVEVKSDARGNVDLDALREAITDEVAGIMLTNPNTLGLFEENIIAVAEIVHSRGGLLYYDGANFNAILGKVRPGDMGFDVIHLNLHKSFSTPHGGGGPGSGPVGVGKDLLPFLPVPVIGKSKDRYVFDYDRPLSIGKIRSFYGNFGVLVRAYAYILSMGADGLREVAHNAVLNANYLSSRLKGSFLLPYDRICKHEFVLSGKKQHDEKGVSTLDMAKALMDHGYHPPTIYFPLVVEEAMMIEPTETEGKETLDGFAEALLAIAKEAEENPDRVKAINFWPVA
jgi:glycine dehydrogenase subunit 2